MAVDTSDLSHSVSYTDARPEDDGGSRKIWRPGELNRHDYRLEGGRSITELRGHGGNSKKLGYCPSTHGQGQRRLSSAAGREEVVERKGIEPSTFALRTRRSPN